MLAALLPPSAGRSLTRSFVNDVLLAMACRESGIVLVSNNTADFERIARSRKFAFVSPWPSAP